MAPVPPLAPVGCGAVLPLKGLVVVVPEFERLFPVVTPPEPVTAAPSPFVKARLP